ncbi:MAG: hypothetical protein LBU99_04760 [Spirochaetaceae bacterium]|jgi:hypothetical protein|nr:hypothetical protein [Spirochaetaceae bacterium]
MYEQLVFDLKKSAQTATGSDDIERIVTKHRELLLAALDETADADNRRGDIQRICSEYSTDLQRSILGYHFDDLAEPILDIGCGEGAHFVTEGLQRGKRIVGIDQYISKEYSDTILCRNWLEFEYIPGYWGTIVSHMAFTNHFIYHLKHKTALVEAYDETYFNILLSLRSGGTWYYSPSIPEIEEKIDTHSYAVRQIAENLNGISVTATQITKL